MNSSPAQNLNRRILGAKGISQSINSCLGRFKFSDSERDYWENRSCGAAVTLICMRYFKKDLCETVTDMVIEGISLKGFGTRGWVHSSIAEMLTKRALKAKPCKIENEFKSIKNIIDMNTLIIASVGVGYPTDGTVGGHLSVVDGYDASDLAKPEVHVRDPAQSQQNAEWVAWDRFSKSFSGRIITCSLC